MKYPAIIFSVLIILSSCGGSDEESRIILQSPDPNLAANAKKQQQAKKLQIPEELEYITAESMKVMGSEEEDLYTSCSFPGFNLRCSSAKKADGDTLFRIDNIGDNNRQTAWVEGAEGYGKGEYFEFDFIFDDTLTRCKYYCDYFTILNGYQKNGYNFYAYSRVKRFKVYIDGVPLCYLDLQDIPGMQFFSLPYFKYLGKNGKATLRFEIVEVYPGNKEKKKETAITELFFSCQP